MLCLQLQWDLTLGGAMNIRAEAPFLRRAATVRRVDALFQAMAGDFLLRQQFITNPTQLLSEYVHGTQLSPDEASVSNQLIYAVVSDRNLLTWLHRYAGEHRGSVPSGARFLHDFAHAVADCGGRHAVIALLRSSIERAGLGGFDEDLLHFFFNLSVVGAIRAGLDEGGDTATGTGDTGTGTGDTGTGDTGTGVTGTGDTGTGVTGTGDTGTGVTGTGDTGTGDTGTGVTGDPSGTGTLTAVTWSTYITQTGTGTGTTPGTITQNPFTGPGPVTRSPFTKTERGTDNRLTEGEFGEFAPNYVMVTLDELANYASRLRENGALELGREGGG
jgi:hypothetical protein